jgi:hypothetical protein
LITPGVIASEAMKILEAEMTQEYGLGPVFSLVEVTLKDGTVLGPIMLELTPFDIDKIASVLHDKPSVVTFANENESILVPAKDIKYIKAMRVTSKE